MILLIAFAFLAGIVTILSPCILPILPIILSSTIGGHESGKSRPLGVVTGFILSFTFFTLFLSTIVKISGIPADALRFTSIVIIAGFGLSFLIPKFQTLLEVLFSKLAGFVPQGNQRTGFGGGLLVGFSLGLLWTPCVGPILASVISLAITGTVTIDALLITFAYSLGTAIPMFLIMLGGQSALRKVPWLLRNTRNIQKVFGILMILTAVGIYFNIDRKFQTFILSAFPQYGIGLTQFEDNEAVKKRLENLQTETKKEDMGKPMFDLIDPKGVKAPTLIPGGRWFNSDPLTLESLRGKVVAIDFWTYSCINCQRTFPYLRNWYEKYKNKGLVIIGVHSPEFEFEKNEKNVSDAISDFNLEYPIVQDNDFATWRAYTNRYWPAKYFIDKEGYIRYQHFGEGAYDESERVIQELLKETGVDASNKIENPTYSVDAKTPELYLGYGRIEYLNSPEKITKDGEGVYTAPPTVPLNSFAYVGKWEIMEEYANPKKGASLILNFEAKQVFIVMRSKKESSAVTLSLDNKPYKGPDGSGATVNVDSDKLYKLVELEKSGSHLLRLDFLDDNIELYAFTFG